MRGAKLGLTEREIEAVAELAELQLPK